MERNVIHLEYTERNYTHVDKSTNVKHKAKHNCVGGAIKLKFKLFPKLRLFIEFSLCGKHMTGEK